MPVRAQALTAMHFFASNSDGPKTGESYSTITLKIIKDGTVSAVAGTLQEVDATNAPGIYKVAITGTENTADVCTLCGKSTTTGVTVSPVTWTNITNVDTTVANTYNVVSANSGKLDTIDNFIDTEVAAILADTGTTLNDKIDVIDGIVDAILVDTAALSVPISANVTQVSGSATAADNMELGALSMVAGTSHNSPTPTTEAFASDTGALSSNNNFYNGRILIFTSGTLAGQARTILDYTGSSKLFTCDAFTTAPPNDSNFIIV